MKVVHLTTVDKSGAGRAAIRVTQALRQNGIDASLLCLHNQSGSQYGVKKYNVPKNNLWHRLLYRFHICLPDYKCREKLYSSYKVLDGVHWLHSDIRVERDTEVATADIIHLHWVDQFVDLPSLLKQAKQPIVWTLHDMTAFSGLCNYYYYYCPKYKEQCGKCPAIDSDNEADLSRTLWREKRNLYRKYLHRLHIVTCSNWLATCARESSLLSKADISVIPNCVDTEIYYPMLHQVEYSVLRLMLGAADAKDPNKGYERLVRIITKFALQTEYRVEVLIVGNNSNDIVLPDNINVVSYGFVDSDMELAKIYNKSDVLLYGSYRDNLPNMIMESMACGVPVVAFPIGGIPDLVEHKETGYLAESEDDYIEGIKFCVKNREILGRNSRNKVLREYTPAIVAEKYKKLYLQVCAYNYSD